MKFDRRLLWIAPALALLVVLGPLATDPSPAQAQAQPQTQRAAESQLQAAPRSPGSMMPTPSQPVGDRLPEFPSLLEVSGALLLVCGIGAGALWMLARLRRNGAGLAGGLLGNASTTTRNGPLSLRQSLRLSPRATVHAVEFDGRLLLIGEGDHGPCLLEDAQTARDAHQLATRDLDPGAELADSRTPRSTARPTPIPRPTANVPRTPQAAPRGAPAVLSDFEDVLRTARDGSHEVDA